MGENNLIVPMYAMYHAGKYDIPAESVTISKAANNLYEAMQAFNLQSAYAGDPALMTSMLKIGGEVYNQLRSAAVSLDHCADAVILTANDFRDHDANARQDYENLSARLKNHQVTPPAHDPSLPDLTKDGGADYTNYDRPYGHGGIQTPPTVHVAPTHDPGSVTTDKSNRDGVAAGDLGNNPLPTLPDAADR